MTHFSDESLSALVDDETSDFEMRRLHNVLCASDEARARWERYHLIRESMRGNITRMLRRDFAVSVMSRLDEEGPAAEITAESRPWKLLRPAVGLAVAASIAVVTVLGVQSLTAPTAPLSPIPVAQVDPALPDVRQVTAETAVPSSFGASPRLNSYLVNHAEYAARQGMMPYARIVSYDMTESE